MRSSENQTQATTRRCGARLNSDRAPAKLQRMFSLTSRACVVQFESGNTATSFGARQLAAAFLHSAAPEAVLYTRKHAFCNQSLTKCKFHKSFILTFMQNAGGVGGNLNFPTPKPFTPATFCIHPLCFDTLAHSFALFCTLAKLNSFISKRLRTLCQKHRGWGTR